MPLLSIQMNTWHPYPNTMSKRRWIFTCSTSGNHCGYSYIERIISNLIQAPARPYIWSIASASHRIFNQFPHASRLLQESTDQIQERRTSLYSGPKLWIIYWHHVSYRALHESAGLRYARCFNNELLRLCRVHRSSQPIL